MRPVARRKRVIAALLALGLLPLGGCRELDAFSTGSGEIYRGAIVKPDEVRNGINVDGDTVNDVFGPATTMTMTLRVEDFQTNNVARVTTSDGLLTDAPLLSVPQLWNDTLSGLSFPAGRLRSGLYFVRASAGAPGGLAGRELAAVLSLMVNGSVELRVLSAPDSAPDRGDGLYGLFRLHKEHAGTADAGADDSSGE